MGKNNLSFSEIAHEAFQSSGLLSEVSIWRHAISDIVFGTSSAAAPLTTGTKLVGGALLLAGTAVGVKLLGSLCRKRSIRDAESGDAAAGPAPMPLLGNVLQLQRGYYKTLHSYIHAPAFVVWVLWTPYVVINEEAGIRTVLGSGKGLYTKPKYFGYRSKAVKQAMEARKDVVASESIAYEPNGDASRRALEGLVGGCFGQIKTCMDGLMRELAEGEEGSKDKFIRRAVVRLNLEVLFGVTEEDCGRIGEMIDFAGREFAQRMLNPLKVWYDIISNVRFFMDVGGLIQLGRRLCGALDEQAKKSGHKEASEMSWVHAWIGKVGTVGKLGKVVGLLMASTQTVPLTAVWMLHVVGNNKDIRMRLRRELEEGGMERFADVTYEKMTQLRLADAVVKETLRLYPPFPLIQREAQEDNIIGGISVDKGTIVYVIPWLIHHNEKFWKEANRFRPDRFLENERHGDGCSDWVYVPFGRGSRMCAGSKLALAELKVLLIKAVLEYRWTSVRENGDVMYPELGMVPDGIRMQFERL